MAVPKETIWELDPHSRAKHEILRRYLGAWFPILNTHRDKILYVDGFCGPGRYKDGEPGSPIIALDVARNHRQTLGGEVFFWFVDEREDRIENLKHELTAMQLPEHFQVRTEVGKFHEIFIPVLDQFEVEGKLLIPAFVFIDPFGFSGIPFRLISRLLGHPHCEVFITFMVDSINRFLESQVSRHVAEVFGTDAALVVAREAGNRVENLRKLYQKQLQTVASFVRYFEMRDDRDRPQYYLFFASNHRKGHLKMKEAMWKVSPEGEFMYSDATDPNQLVLLGIDSTPALTRILMDRFSGQKAAGHRIRSFVEDETAFIGKHRTAAMLQLEDSRQIQVEPIKLDGKRRRAHTYPGDVMVSFSG